ncbi:hypothetical protein TNCV_1875151 [Trichonephila clavipes]|nr:hypothetical protein TNCV_1875151 [Trichonephila clavipes]
MAGDGCGNLMGMVTRSWRRCTISSLTPAVLRIVRRKCGSEGQPKYKLVILQWPKIKKHNSCYTKHFRVSISAFRSDLLTPMQFESWSGNEIDVLNWNSTLLHPRFSKRIFDTQSVSEPDKSSKVIEEVLDLARQINLEVDSDDIILALWSRGSVSRFHTAGPGSIPGLEKVNSAFHPYCSGWLNEH